MRHPDWLKSAIKNGLVDPAALSAPPDTAGFELSRSLGAGCWIVGVRTISVANNRDWKLRSAATKEARKKVCDLFARSIAEIAPLIERIHSSPCKIGAEFTRLGGRRMDHANLGGAIKAVEDAVCLYLGIDDGDPRYEPEYFQAPGSLSGVMIKLWAEVPL